MRLTNKLCVVCGSIYTPTGCCSKYCGAECRSKIWNKQVLSARTYAWQVAKGIIKNPGVGTGHAQGSGKDHHSFKDNAPGRYRDYIKDKCERCLSTKNLCGHHKDHNRANNARSNIETLCKRCHQIEHKCHENFSVGFNDERRAKLSSNMIKLNKTLVRVNGRNSKRGE